MWGRLLCSAGILAGWGWVVGRLRRLLNWVAAAALPPRNDGGGPTRLIDRYCERMRSNPGGS